jgi:hypothetical protein
VKFKSGESHTLQFDKKGDSYELSMHSTPVKYEDFVNNMTTNPPEAKGIMITMAKSIDQRQKRYASVPLDQRKAWSDQMVKDLNELAAYTAEFAVVGPHNNVEGQMPPTVVEWYGTNVDGFSKGFNAQRLSKNYIGGEKSTKYGDYVYGWTFSNSRWKLSSNTGTPMYSYIRAHLLNDHLGGPAKAYNFTPIAEQMNKDHVGQVESKVKKIVLGQSAGNDSKSPIEVANYEVIALYDGHPPRDKLRVPYNDGIEIIDRKLSRMARKDFPNKAAQQEELRAARQKFLFLNTMFDAEERLTTGFVCSWQKLVYDNATQKYQPQGSPETVALKHTLPEDPLVYHQMPNTKAAMNAYYNLPPDTDI